MIDLHAIRFAFPDFAREKVLVLGLGGGSDIITAYAVCQLLSGHGSSGIVYANTKNSEKVGPSEAISPHIVRVHGPVLEHGNRGRGYGKGRIDHSVPCGPEGCPWIVLLTDEQAERELVREILSLGFDRIIGVDTGGDSIANKHGRGHLGRDQRMLQVICQTRLPVLHIVVAPGSDGEATFDDLQNAFEQHAIDGRYHGCFSLEPILPVLRSFTPILAESRTPRIILRAADGLLGHPRADCLEVPRGCKPVVPRSWLTSGFVLSPAIPKLA